MMVNIFIAAALVSCFSFIRTGQSGTNCKKEAANGTCFCCKSGFRGPNCDIMCAPCTSRTVGEKCVYLCKNGFYGETCNKKCPSTCAVNGKGFNLCEENNGEPDCKGCDSGYYGDQCNKKCHSNCHDWTCFQIDGTCNKCNNSQFHGDYCNMSCSVGCSSGTCSKSGCCIDGCRDGVYGERCIHPCGSNCLQKRCKSDNYSRFTCTEGCKDGFYGDDCESKCGSNCMKRCIKDNFYTYNCTEGCRDGYMGTNCSDKCLTNCNKCDRISGRCTSCMDEYIQVAETGKCTTAEVDWVAPSVASTVIIAITITIIIIFIIICKKKRQEDSALCFGQMMKNSLKSNYSHTSQMEDGPRQLCIVTNSKQFVDGSQKEFDEQNQYCIKAHYKALTVGEEQGSLIKLTEKSCLSDLDI